MRLWEQLELWIINNNVTTFDHKTLRKSLGVSRREASYLIAGFQDAQNRPNSQTSLVISRTGRTSAAVWHVGHRAMDAKRLCWQSVDDLHRRYERAVLPSLKRIANLNPRSLAAVQARVALLEANIEQLELVLAGMT